MSIVAREIASDGCGCGCDGGNNWLGGSNNFVWIIFIIIIFWFVWWGRGCGFGGFGGVAPYGGYGAAVGYGNDCDCGCKKCCRKCCC